MILFSIIIENKINLLPLLKFWTMKSVHFRIQSILLVINLLLFVSPFIGLLFAIVTGSVQMLHSIYLIATIKEKPFTLQIAIHLSVATVYLLLFYTRIATGFTFLALATPVLLAIYFWGITLQIHNKIKKGNVQNDLDDFLQPNNTME
jgi:hypothetical protein